MKEKYKILIKDTLIFSVGSFGSKLILFLLVPLYTNYLTTEEYGISDLVFTLSQFFIPITSLVIYNAVLRFGLSKYEKKEDVLISAFVIFGFSIIANLIITPFIGFYDAIAEWKWYLSVYVIIYILNTIILNYIKVLGKNKIFAFISIAQTATLALSNFILLIVLRVGIEGYLLSNIISCSIAVLIGCFTGNIINTLKKGKVDFKLIKRMIAFSAPIIANDLSWWLIHSTDKIMVEYMVGASALGLYTVATKIPALINVIISIFLQAWGIATIAENESTNDQRFYSNVFKIYSFIAFGASVFLTAIIKLFMSIYVGFEFIDSWRYIPLLLVSASFSAISSYYGSLYGAFKRNISSMVTTIIGAIANLILNYVFIRIYGIWGAIIGTIVAYIIISTFRMIDTRKFVKFEINFARYLFNGFIVLVQAILVSLNWNIYIVSAIAIVLFVTINIDSIKLFISMLRSKLKQNNRVEEE